MNAQQALYQYLIDTRTLPGHPDEKFLSAQRVGELTLWSRNDARRELRNRIGKNIYAGRRPQNAGHTAIELRTVTENPEYGLQGEEDCGEELLLATVYASKGDAALRAANAAALLRIAVSGYAGDNWGDLYIGECLCESTSSNAIAPGDGSDDWTQAVTLDLTVRYRHNSVPLYPVERLTAIAKAFKGSGQLRLDSTASIIVPNRALATANWVLRDTNASGSSVLVISGPANDASSVANVGGTYANPVVDTSMVSLPTIIWAQLTLTDETGATAKTEFLING